VATKTMRAEVKWGAAGRLAAALGCSVAVIALPPLLLGSPQSSPLWFLALVGLGGVMLGLGTQNVPLLFVRITLAALLSLAVWIVFDAWIGHAALCRGDSCGVGLVVGVGFGALFLVPILSLTAIPANFLWTRYVSLSKQAVRLGSAPNLVSMFGLALLLLFALFLIWLVVAWVLGAPLVPA
jgi:hypothetical protein